MTDPHLLPPSGDALPEAVVEPRRRLNPSLVWLIPLLAAVIGGWLAVNAVLSRGPTIYIRFASGQGLEPGKTRIKFKDVDVGEVSAVSLTPDRRYIEVTAQLAKEAEPYVVDGTRFWVVRPRISGGTVSGLDTLLSGSYIAMDAGRSARRADHFVGLDEAPIISSDRPGSQFSLLGADLGSLEIGSPVLYRRVPVGQVVGYHLTPDGQNVAVAVFVNAPYDRFVTADSRFWHASGIDVQVDANGFKLDTQSLVSMALGGISFDVPPDATSQRKPLPGQNFVLAADKDQAMRMVESRELKYLLLFNESVRGLGIGAPVDFRGIVVGEVANIALDVDAADSKPRMAVTVRLYPSRLEALAENKATLGNISNLTMQEGVARGLRAQLRNGNLLTGQLYVALDFFPDAPKARVTRYNGLNVVPTVHGGLSDLQQSLVRIAKQIERMQLDTLSANARETLRSLNTTLQHTDKLVSGIDQHGLPQMLSTLQSMQQTLDSARQSLRPDAPLQQDLRDAAQQVSAAARSVQALSDSLERNPESLLRGKSGDKQ
jgi:paraquat-inducible protein B